MTSWLAQLDVLYALGTEKQISIKTVFEAVVPTTSHPKFCPTLNLNLNLNFFA